jgi:hypothetical protein
LDYGIANIERKVHRLNLDQMRPAWNAGAPSRNSRRAVGNSGPVSSRTLPKELEDEIRSMVFDKGNGPADKKPQLIIGNRDTGCHGVFYERADGSEFIFYHSMDHKDPCGCIVKGEPGSSTWQIPQALDDHRIWLIFLSDPCMEPVLAAMVVMKLYLGLHVPEQFRI